MSDAPLVELRGVSHQFDGEPVLQGVDWTIRSGDSWSVLGPSGAGKTTLVEVLAGYLRPSAGTVLRNGDQSTNLPSWRRHVGWLSNDLLDRVPRRQSVKDTVVAGKYSQTLKAERSDLRYTEKDDEHARDLLDRVGLAGKADRSFSELSQGERQLALVARSFMNQPDLLVMDEPCAGLDPGARERFLSELAEFLEARSGTTLAYVTHHVEEILPGFNSLLALSEGRVVFSGDKQRFLEAGDLSEVYGTGFDLTERNGRYWPTGRS